MLSKFKKHIKENFNFLYNTTSLLAVSGGIDSIVLAHLLTQLNINFAIAHCNFNLRGDDSNNDEKFVIELAKKLNKPVFTIQFDTKNYCKTNNLNTQLGARALRYDWFEKLCIKNHFEYIITAHHLNDSLETFVLNLSRGTGLKGLTGIPATNNKIIRPLLIFPRQQILAYANNNGILWREDQSNAETKYNRNKIRHHITPYLKALHPNFENNFLQTIQYLQDSEDYIQQQLQKLKQSLIVQEQGHLTINKKESNLLSDFEKYHIYNDFGFHHTAEIQKIHTAQIGAVFTAKKHQLTVTKESFIISEKQNSPSVTNQLFLITSDFETNHIPKNIGFNISKTKPTAEFYFAIPKSKIIFPICLRTKKEGDEFYPKNLTLKKKIGKFLRDEKMSPLDKKQILVIENGNSEIIGIYNYTLDKRYTKASETEEFIYIYKK